MAPPSMPPTQLPSNIVRGSSGEIQWEYNTLTRIHVKKWPREYYDTWYDWNLHKLRPVRWQCMFVKKSAEEIVETWYWTNVGGL